MPVVINEFEVVSDAAQPQAAGTPAPASDAPKPKLEPAMLQEPLHRLHEQSLRVWVH